MNRRSSKHTIFIGCEGKTEVAFLKHIKKLYIDGKIKYVRLQSVDGGGGLKSIEKMIKKYETDISFDEFYGFLDGDLIGKNEKPKPHILVTKPCIEGFFLVLLDQIKPASSKACKKQFESNVLNEKQKLDHRHYESIFIKYLLERKRKTNPLLNKILKIFE